MVQKPPTSFIMVRVPPADKQWLQEEAAKNLTSQSVEALRAIRERREREEAEQARAVHQ